MKILASVRNLILVGTLALALLPSSVKAQYFVFDIENLAKNTAMLAKQGEQVGLTTQTLQTAIQEVRDIQKLQSYINNPQSAIDQVTAMGVSQLAQQLHTVPGFQNFDLGAVLRGQSPMSVFLGQGFNTWSQVVGNPAQGVAQEVVRTMNGSGSGSYGSGAEQSFAARVQGLIAGTGGFSRAGLITDFAKILSAKSLRDLQEQGQRAEVFSQLNAGYRQQAQNNNTVNGQLALLNQGQATTNDLLNQINSHLVQKAAQDSLHKTSEAEVLTAEEQWRRAKSEWPDK